MIPSVVGLVFFQRSFGISQEDLRAHEERISDTYAAAITNAHIQFVVNLSSKGEFN